MLLVEAVCVLVGFILCISGAQERANSICALKGSSVDLPCTAEHHTSSMKWFTEAGSTSPPIELSADGNHAKYNLSEESILTIKDLRESDAKIYCCTALKDCCCKFELHVTDLQVKVTPATEGTVTLMCNTSCPLTENPAAYIWYKNGNFLYKDWSPWYQQLVSSEKAVRYSCAIEGYEHLRAPEVSVDSVSLTCFTVTYTKGRMCPDEQTLDKPCSITYPREVHVQRSSLKNNIVTLTCATSCPLADPHTAFRMYGDRQLYSDCESQDITVFNSSSETFSCAINGNEDLHSTEVCINKDCGSVNYVSRRICALESSSVNISIEYSHSCNMQSKSQWYKTETGGDKDAENVINATGRVEYHNKKNRHILTINDLQKNDSAEYTFRRTRCIKWKKSNLGVALIVTGLSVKIKTAVVTEYERVTLTCSTSCPLTDDTNYIWYFNGQLALPENKHLTLDPVSMQHAGNYSCAVKTLQNIISSEKTLTVKAREKTIMMMNAVKVIFLSLNLTAVFSFYLWMRKKNTLTPTGKMRHDKAYAADMAQPEQVYESIPLRVINPAAQKEPAEQQDSTV